MIKVLHVTYDMRIGGTEMVIKNIIEGNGNTGIEMSIFCIEAPLGPWGQELQANGIHITTKERKPGFDVSLIFALRKHIKQQAIDVLHCHQYTPWVYGALASIGTKARVIFTEHGRFYPDSTTWKRRIINPLLLKCTAAVTAISKATKAALVEFEFIPEHRIDVIYNGIAPLVVDNEETQRIRTELNIPDDHIVLGTIARFDPIKNHQLMINAFKQVHDEHPNTTLIMVGDGEERANIENTITSLGLKESVILTGYQSKPANYLNLMDVFLLSSLSEGTSMTLLEAMSIGKPCVVTDAGGNKEIVEENVNGYVTPNSEYISFTYKIISLIRNHSQITTMKKNAYSRYKKMFTREKMNSSYKDLYKSRLYWKK